MTSLLSLKRSLWVYHMNSGSCNGCDIEIVALLTPRYDVERFGIKLVGTPRHADVLLMTGPVTKAMTDKIKRVFMQAPSPKVVMVIGVCGITGGVFYDSYTLDGPLDKVIKEMDDEAKIIYVPGCPVRPEAIIDGVAKAWMVLESLEKEGKK